VHNDDVPRALVFKRLADFFANTPDVPQIEVAIGLNRGANANERQFRFRVAWAGSLVARSRPASVVDAMISPMSASMMGDRPSFTRSTFVLTGSTTIT